MSTETKPEPNLKWCDEDEPYLEYREGTELISMPSADEQRAGFYHEEPGRIQTLSGGKIHRFDDCNCSEAVIDNQAPETIVSKKKSKITSEVTE